MKRRTSKKLQMTSISLVGYGRKLGTIYNPCVLRDAMNYTANYVIDRVFAKSWTDSVVKKFRDLRPNCRCKIWDGEREDFGSASLSMRHNKTPMLFRGRDRPFVERLQAMMAPTNPKTVGHRSP